MSQKAGDSGEMGLQLIKESLVEDFLAAHVFVVLGASVCHYYCNRSNPVMNE